MLYLTNSSMGVIYGYISTTDKPIDPATLGAMQKANSFWNPDGDGLWSDTHAGLGSLILFNTPEAIFEKQPLHFADNHKVLVATARIDNRDELCRIFDIPISARDLYPDSFYIKLAYEKWGEACPDHLLGDWCFAVYNKLNRKLFIARDHHGITALYYYKGSDFFVFSSSLKGILCLPQVEKKINEYKIAQILVNWNEGGPQTCYLDILRLPPAHTLSLEKGNVTTNRYWYLEHTPEIHFKNDDEYIEMFRELYTEAVRCRLRSYRPVGATLSGGLDSGSVCILAAQELAKYGKRLPAFTAVPLYDVPWPKNRIGDEGPLALALAEKLGNVDVTLCRAENISPLEGVESFFNIYNQIGFATGNSIWMLDIFNRINFQGFGVLLIGQNGNGTVSWPTLSILKKREKNYKQILWNYKSLFKLKSGLWEKDFLINPKLVRKYRLDSLLNMSKSRIYFMNSLNSRDIRLQIINPGKNSIGEIWSEWGNFYKIEVRDPTIDKYLMRFLFSIPTKLNKYDNRKNFEMLFLKFFPIEILSGKIRGLQSSDINLRIEPDIKIIIKELIVNSDLLSDYISIKKMNYLINNYSNKNDINKLLKIYAFLCLRKFTKN